MFISVKVNMKQRYRVFLRPWGVYYCEDLETGKQETLKTRDKNEAFRLVAAKNEDHTAPAFSRQLARVYWKAGDPAGAGKNYEHTTQHNTLVSVGRFMTRESACFAKNSCHKNRHSMPCQRQIICQLTHFIGKSEVFHKTRAGAPGAFTRIQRRRLSTERISAAMMMEISRVATFAPSKLGATVFSIAGHAVTSTRFAHLSSAGPHGAALPSADGGAFRSCSVPLS